jgi:hypothetical protein
MLNCILEENRSWRIWRLEHHCPSPTEPEPSQHHIIERIQERRRAASDPEEDERPFYDRTPADGSFYLPSRI